MTRVSGFTLTEAMVSISIIALISSLSVVSFTTAARNEELNSGARIVASALRSAQSQALATKNIRLCDAGAALIVCEFSSAGCTVPASCRPQAPGGVGVAFEANTSVVKFYAIPDVDATDWRLQTEATQHYASTDLALSGAPNVIVSGILWSGTTSTSASIAFQRQNAVTRINACPACGAEPGMATVILSHQKSGASKQVTINRITGRVSIE